MEYTSAQSSVDPLVGKALTKGAQRLAYLMVHRGAPYLEDLMNKRGEVRACSEPDNPILFYLTVVSYSPGRATSRNIASLVLSQKKSNQNQFCSFWTS